MAKCGGKDNCVLALLVSTKRSGNQIKVSVSNQWNAYVQCQMISIEVFAGTVTKSTCLGVKTRTQDEVDLGSQAGPYTWQPTGLGSSGR